MSKEAMKLALEALEGLEALLLSMGLTHLIVYGDAEKAITNLQEALAEQPAQQEPEYKGWYCAHCQRGVDGSEVTYNEQHTVCGRVITDDLPPKPQQEPVKHELQCICGCSWEIDADGNEELVSSPPAQRKPLTDEQREEIAKGWRGRNWTVGDIIDATEAAHGIKENT